MSLFAFDLIWSSQGFLSENGLGGQLSLVAFFEQKSSIRIALDIFFLTFFSGFYIVPLNTLIQLVGTKEKLPLIIAGQNMIASFSMVLSSLLAACLLSINYDSLDIFLYIAIGNIIAALIIEYFILKAGKFYKKINEEIKK